MKILSLNTHSLLNDDQDHKTEILVKNIATQAYDIIALQEVNQTITKKAVLTNPLCSHIPIKEDNFALTLVSLLKNKGMTYYLYYLPVHIGYDRFDEGHALLSLKPLDKLKAIPVSKNDDYDDYKTRCNLLGYYQNTQIISVHMGWEDDPNDPFHKQWSRMCQQIDHSEPFIIMGDFNIKDSSKSYELIRSWDSYHKTKNKVGYETVFSAIDGWKTDHEKKRIDYILTSDHFDILSHETIFNGNHEAIISDHYGITVKLKQSVDS